MRGAVPLERALERRLSDLQAEVDQIRQSTGRGRLSFADGLVIGGAVVTILRSDEGAIRFHAVDQETGQEVTFTAGVAKYTTIAGDGTSTTITIPHGLGVLEVIAQAFSVATGAQLDAVVSLVDEGTISLAFSVAPGVGDARIVVVG